MPDNPGPGAWIKENIAPMNFQVIPVQLGMPGEMPSRAGQGDNRAPLGSPQRGDGQILWDSRDRGSRSPQ
jgi:hypothetical protein